MSNRDLEQQVQDLLDGRLDDPGQRALAILLREDAEAREIYRHYAVLDSALSRLVHGHMLLAEHDDTGALAEKRQRSRSLKLSLLVAAAVVMLGATVMWYILVPDQPRPFTDVVLRRNMLADGAWMAQAKVNGWRCIVHVCALGIFAWSRHQRPLELPPEIEERLGRIADEVWLDCELLGKRHENLHEDGLILLDVMAAPAAPRSSAVVLGGTPLERRREMAAEYAAQAELPLVEAVTSGYAAFFEKTKERPAIYEGIVLKRMGSGILVRRAHEGEDIRGFDNPDWMKIRWMEVPL